MMEGRESGFVKLPAESRTVFSAPSEKEETGGGRQEAEADLQPLPTYLYCLLLVKRKGDSKNLSSGIVPCTSARHARPLLRDVIATLFVVLLE